MSNPRLAVMPNMFSHVKQEARAMDFARERMDLIDDEIEQLKMEKQMWKSVIDGFKATACGTCHGSGEVGYYPYGMDDGMRFKKCDACKGTGKP